MLSVSPSSPRPASVSLFGSGVRSRSRLRRCSATVGVPTAAGELAPCRCVLGVLSRLSPVLFASTGRPLASCTLPRYLFSCQFRKCSVWCSAVLQNNLD